MVILTAKFSILSLLFHQTLHIYNYNYWDIISNKGLSASYVSNNVNQMSPSPSFYNNVWRNVGQSERNCWSKCKIGQFETYDLLRKFCKLLFFKIS